MDRPADNPNEYEDAVRWIYDRVNYERIRPRQSSPHFRLERVEQLLSAIGSPQTRIPAIHIAGTKGKGSTAAILDSIFRRSGIRTGLFTSPHIFKFEERMKVDDRMPSPVQLTALVHELQDRLTGAPKELSATELTYFEVATLLAWMFFDQSEAEYVILETGLGGRLDCTNVCRPLATLITSISLDHTHILGDTVEQIATEKAGILKPQVPALSSVRDVAAANVIRQKAEELNCELYQIGDDFTCETNDGDDRFDVITKRQRHSNLQLGLIGNHQQQNAALAVATADVIAEREPRLTPQAIRDGVAQTHWPLRFEEVEHDGTFVLDVAHNPDSIKAFCATLRQHYSDRPRLIIFASSQDKDFWGMLKQLSGHAEQLIVTRFLENPRAVDPEDLLQRAGTTDGFPPAQIHSANSPTEAVSLARRLAPEHGVIGVCGSFFLAAEVRRILIVSE